MPSRVTVVTLSDAEKATMTAAGAANASKAVGEEIARLLKDGDDSIRLLGGGKEVTAEQAAAAQRALGVKQALLQKLPECAARDALAGEVDRAVALVGECRSILGD